MALPRPVNHTIAELLHVNLGISKPSEILKCPMYFDPFDIADFIQDLEDLSNKEISDEIILSWKTLEDMIKYCEELLKPSGH